MALGNPGLRTRVVVLLAVALVPGFALLAWLRTEMRGIQTAELERSVVQLAQLAAEGQSGRNHGAGQLLAAFASNPVVRSGDPAACNAFFQTLIRQENQAYANFGLMGPDGELVCAANPSSRPVSGGDREYFKEAIATRRLAVSDLSTGKITGRPIVVYALAVLDAGRVVGVVFASMDVESLSQSLARVNLPPGGVIGILDRDGVVAARYPISRGQTTRVPLPPEARDGMSVRETTGPDGLRRLYAAVPVDANRTMFAVAGLLTAPVTSEADSRVRAAVLILLGCTVVVFTLALIGAEYEIRRPVMRLLNATTRFGQGDADARVGDAGGARELRELGQGFDRMLDLLTAREAQMRQSQRLEAVGQLAGGIAHDFNNILTAILGFGEELRDHVRTAVGRQYLFEVLAAADRAKELTRQLLAFSRRQVLQPKIIQLNTVIAEFSALLKRVIGEDITLVTKLGSDLGHVRADRTQIEQVLMNLVVNARDAMPGGGLLTIATDQLVLGPNEVFPDVVGETTRIPPGRYVRLLVSDSGEGIDADTQGRIFEPFFSTKGHKGTGLGLATVYGIVRQSGGYISVWSEVGVGTAFSILLPQTTAPIDAIVPQPAAGPSTSGHEKVLVVEDDASVRSLAAAVLRHRGYTVLEVPSGEAAIEQIEAGFVPDVLLCDLVMPGMNGHQVASAVRLRHAAVRVVYMSGYDSHAALSHTAMADHAFLQKPFTPDSLVHQVRSALDYAVS